MQQRDQVFHQRQLLLRARLPAQLLRGEEFAQGFTVEDHATQDAVHKTLQGGGGEAMFGGHIGDGLVGFGDLILCVFLSNALHGMGCAGVEAIDVFGKGVPVVDEFGIGLDQANQRGAAHLLLARRLAGIAGNQCHDVVVIDHATCKQHELEIKLLHLGRNTVAVFILLFLQALGGVEVHAFEALQLFPGQYLLDGGLIFRRQISVLIQLGVQALHLLEQVDELAAGGVALEVGHGFGLVRQPLRLHERIQLLHGRLQLIDDHRSLVHQPDFLGGFGGLAGKQPDGGIHGCLLLAEIEDVAVGFDVVEHAVGARKRLNQAVVLEVLIDVEGVQIFGIEAGKQHIHHDDDIDLLRVGQVLVGILLILDAFLHILIVKIELAHAVIAAVSGVVVGDDGLEGRLLFIRRLFVIGFFLRQVFLNLLHILVAFGGRREHAGHVQRLEVRVSGLFFRLDGLEQSMVFDGVIDRGRSQNRIKLTLVGGGTVLGENGFDDGFFSQRLARLRRVVTLELIVIHMEAQHIAILDGVGNSVGVQLLLKDILSGFIRRLLTFDLLIAGVVVEDRRTGEAEQLRVGKEFLDRLVVLAKLRAVAFVENEHHALIA